jgi:MinD-like ATPase involved in chromosome partitioning or flagellar assembly
LGSISIDQKISEASDEGMSLIVEHANSLALKAFFEIVKKLEAFLKEKSTLVT